jgi:two-component system chemotaxis response regulator CheB
MSACPTPIIMLSSVTSEGSISTIKAMELGAVDFVSKPSGSISLDLRKIEDILISKVKVASDIPLHKLSSNHEKMNIVDRKPRKNHRSQVSLDWNK